ncbi:hypothetical protein ABPG74_005025 [Tetrahymena malaccensis]
MSEKKNIIQQSELFINDNYSLSQIIDKSCQKQLFQCRNANVQKGLPGDNSLVQSYADAVEHQITTDQFSILQAINEKTYEFKEDMYLNLQNNNQEILNSEVCQYHNDQTMDKQKEHEIKERNTSNIQIMFSSAKQQNNKNVTSTQQNNSIEPKFSNDGSNYIKDQQKQKQTTQNYTISQNKYFRILQKIISLSQKSRMNSYNARQMLLINDLVHFDQQLNQQSNIGIKSLIINKIDNLPIITPTSKLLIIWDCFCLIYLSTFYYLLSIIVFFDFQPAHSQIITSLCILALFILLIEIIIHLNTAFINEEIIVKERKKIILKYIFSLRFLSDFLSAISLLLKVSADSCQDTSKFSQIYILNCLLFIKLYTLQIKKQNIENNFANKLYFNSVYEIFKNIGIITIAAHIASIGWYLQTKIYSFYYPEGLTWVMQLQIESEEFYIKYIYSFYWAISTLSTNGNNSFCAQNILEILYLSLSILAFAIVCVYSLSNMGFVFWNIYQQERHFQKNVYLINSYLRNCNVDSDLKFKVKEYLSVFSEHLKSPQLIQQTPILNNLPKNLRDQIIFQCGMIKSLINQQLMSQQRLAFNRQKMRSQNTKGLLKILKQQQIQTETEEYKSSNFVENDFYTFSQIKDENQFSNSQITESSPLRKRNLKQIKKRQNLKEQVDKTLKKSQMVLDQNFGEAFNDIKEQKSSFTFDQMQELDGQESQIKQMKSNKSRNTSFLKNSITVDTCSISDIAKNTNTNSKLNFQQDDETINVTSNLISDFQIKDIQKIYKQLTNSQQQQNNEQFCNNFTNRCSIDSNNNLNCIQDMILNVNGQIIYDQTEYQNPSAIISTNEIINKEQSLKQPSRIDAFQQQVCLNQKNNPHDLQRKQNMLDNLILNYRSIFQKYDQTQSPTTLQIDSIQKFKYYFPMCNCDIILKQQQKYIFTKSKKKFESGDNLNPTKKL